MPACSWLTISGCKRSRMTQSVPHSRFALSALSTKIVVDDPPCSRVTQNVSLVPLQVIRVSRSIWSELSMLMTYQPFRPRTPRMRGPHTDRRIVPVRLHLPRIRSTCPVRARSRSCRTPAHLPHTGGYANKSTLGAFRCYSALSSSFLQSRLMPVVLQLSGSPDNYKLVLWVKFAAFVAVHPKAVFAQSVPCDVSDRKVHFEPSVRVVRVVPCVV